MKRGPYRYAFGAVCLALAVACSGADTTGTEISAVEMITGAEATLELALQADRDFAAMAATDGVKAAFAEFMAEDGKRIEPGAVVRGSADVLKLFDGLPPGFVLEWKPDDGYGSASGDLAVTTGRYAAKLNGEEQGAGRYVTVWRKNAAGALKAAMDLGVPDPGPQTTGPDPEGRPG